MKEDIKERIESFRTGLPRASGSKKKPWLLLINILLILVLLFIIRKNPEKGDTAYSIEYDNLLYTFTITGKNSNNHQLTAEIRSLSANTHVALYRSSIINIVYKIRNDVVYRSEIGTGVNSISFSPNEIKLFNETIDKNLFMDFLKNHPQAAVPKRKNMFSTSNEIPVTALLTINNKYPVTVYLKFNIPEI